MIHSNIKTDLLGMNTNRRVFDVKFLEFRGSKEKDSFQDKNYSSINIWLVHKGNGKVFGGK